MIRIRQITKCLILWKDRLMKKTDIKYYIYLQLLLIILSFGGVVSKTASVEKFLSFEWIVLYGVLVFILGIYAIFWQQILKHIMLSKAYACKAITVVWGMIWGVVFFHEHLTLTNILGGALVIAGVVLVASGKEPNDNSD